MMTGIHAKPSRGSEAGASGSDVTGKKRPLDSAAGTGSGLEKRKKDKKKALKRL